MPVVALALALALTLALALSSLSHSLNKQTPQRPLHPFPCAGSIFDLASQLNSSYLRPARQPASQLQEG